MSVDVTATCDLDDCNNSATIDDIDWGGENRDGLTPWVWVDGSNSLPEGWTFTVDGGYLSVRCPDHAESRPVAAL